MLPEAISTLLWVKVFKIKRFVLNFGSVFGYNIVGCQWFFIKNYGYEKNNFNFVVGDF